jgi:Domain of unknown function (DUF5666)
MRRTLLAMPLAILMVHGPATPDLLAQEAKVARGTITAVAADSLTVKVRDREMKFAVDAKTTVVATGAGTQARRAASEGKPGPQLTELIRSGQAVEVSYAESGRTMHATRIRRVTSAGAGGGSVSEPKPATETSNGTVTSVAADSLTISGSSGGGATFKQIFTVDANTKVVGVGAGTAAAARGGKIALTELVGTGDKVTVSSSKSGSTLHADDVRVTSRAAKK